MDSFNLKQEIITEIRTIAKKYDIQKIVLFGSRARGTNSPKSDIDLAIFCSPEFKKMGHLACDIDDLDTLLKIDTVFINEDTDKKLMQNIGKEGVIIYERL